MKRREFCAREGLKVETLDYWQHRIHARPVPQRRAADAPATLIPIEVISPLTPQYEIRVGSARSLVIRGAFDVRVVRELIQALEAPA